MTRLPDANELLASRSGTAKRADTSKGIDFIHTGSTVCAGRGLALVNVDSTVGSGKSRGAFTAEPVHTINANSPVVAGVRVAVIGVLSAGGTFPSIFADAGKRVSATHTRSSIQTGAGCTGVVLCRVACTSPPSRCAGAAETVSVIITSPSVIARAGITLTFT